MRTGLAWMMVSLLFCTATAAAEESLPGRWSETDLSGNLKSFFIAVDPARIKHDPQAEDITTEGLVQNKLRLRLLVPISDTVKAESAYEIRPTVQGDLPVLAFHSLSAQQNISTYRVDDLGTELYPDDDEGRGSFNITQNLDRFCLSLSSGFADFIVGRQSIAFGAAHVINPTDVLAPYNFNALDTEDRVGVDAARMRVPISDMGEIDAGLVFGEDAKTESSAAFLRLRQPFGSTDFTFSAIGFKENFLIGLDATRAVKGAGVWVEGAWTWAGLFDERVREDDYFRGSVGVDYNVNWHDGVYFYLEYHYNGASADETDKYVQQAVETAYRDGGVYLLGRNYLGTGTVFQVTPLWGAHLSALVNLGDNSLYFMGALDYNFSENAYLSIGVNVPLGERAKFENGPGLDSLTVHPESEFGLYPALYYTSISFYF